MEIKGQCEERFESVRDLFEELHDSKREKGSSFSVYKNGEAIIDI